MRIKPQASPQRPQGFQPGKQLGVEARIQAANRLWERGAREPRRVPAQARSGAHARAVRGGRGTVRGADLRRPAPRRAAAPLRLPPRAERRARLVGGAEGRAARAGRAVARRPRRGSSARLRDLRGRDPAGASTAPARSSSGTTARTSWSRRSGTAGSPCGSTASRLKGAWTLVPAHLDGKEQNWLLIKRRDGAAPEPRRASHVRADARDAGRRRARGAPGGSSR